MTADPEDHGRRLFIPSKTNLGRAREGLAYRIADTTVMGSDGGLIWAPYVQWQESTVTMTADEAVAAMGGDLEGRSASEEAKQFLLQVLTDGPAPAKEVKKLAEEAGISIASLRRAKHALRVEVCREGGAAEKGQWVWALRCSNKSMSILDTLGENKGVPLRCSTPGDEHLRPNPWKTPKATKVLNPDSEHLSNDCEERGSSREEAEAQVAVDMPDLPEFLDRRRQQRGAA